MPFPDGNDLLNEFFESEHVKALMATQSLTGTMAGPCTPGSPYVFLYHAIGRAIHGRRGVWGYVRGGMGAVTQALAAAARDLGVDIRTSVAVGEVLVSGGIATGVVLDNGEAIRARAVLSNADPQRTFLKLTPASALPAEMVSRATVDIAPTLAYLEEGWNDFKRGQPSREPFIEIFSQSPTDPTMAPEGQHVLSCFCQYFPYQVSGRSWDDGLREQMADRILDKLAEYAPNIKDAVIARQMLSPLDLERLFRLPGSNIFHRYTTHDDTV